VKLLRDNDDDDNNNNNNNNDDDNRSSYIKLRSCSRSCVIDVCVASDYCLDVKCI